MLVLPKFNMQIVTLGQQRRLNILAILDPDISGNPTQDHSLYIFNVVDAMKSDVFELYHRQWI